MSFSRRASLTFTSIRREPNKKALGNDMRIIAQSG
jgi:hypothetical protein